MCLYLRVPPYGADAASAAAALAARLASISCTRTALARSSSFCGDPRCDCHKTACLSVSARTAARCCRSASSCACACARASARHSSS